MRMHTWIDARTDSCTDRLITIGHLLVNRVPPTCNNNVSIHNVVNLQFSKTVNMQISNHITDPHLVHPMINPYFLIPSK